MKQRPVLIILLFAIGLIVACQPAPDTAASAPTEAPAPTAVATVPPPPTETAEPTAASVVDVEPTEGAEAVVEESPTDVPAPTAEPLPTLTPAEQLMAQFEGLPFETNGDQLFLIGQVMDVNGNPIPNAVVEIWQTDSTGVYDHPRDPGTASRDLSFQFYGSAVVDGDGWYGFRTILPGEYEPRPRHIHFKVKREGSTVLTSQFYFSEDIQQVSTEGIFQTAGDDGDLLLLQLVEVDGSVIANGDIVIDTGIGGGELTLTPSQSEGPYYPVVDVSNTDNDLNSLR